jgi:hypothetical protein
MNINITVPKPDPVNVTVNVPKQDAHVVNVAAPVVNVPAPVINVAAPPPAIVNVAAPIVNMPPALSKSLKFETDENGKITGGRVEVDKQ